MKIVVLDGFAADQGHLSWSAFSRYGTVEVFERTTPEQLVDRALDAEAVLTNKVLLTAEVIAQLARLRYIGILATGTNAVDLGACRERGIAVTNVPDYSTRSVAELVFAFMLHASRDVARHDESVRSGGWAASPDFAYCLRPLFELAEKTIAIFGMGAIGSAVAELSRAFRMNVIAAKVPGSPSTGRVPHADALPVADFVTLHCPLTPATSRLVSEDFLRRMKPNAVLINTGRGGLIDEHALARALSAGTPSLACLDVLEREPPAAEHFLLDPNAPWASRLVVTPHVAWATVEARTRLIAAAAENLGAFVVGESRNRVEHQSDPQKLSVPPKR